MLSILGSIHIAYEPRCDIYSCINTLNWTAFLDNQLCHTGIITRRPRNCFRRNVTVVMGVDFSEVPQGLFAELQDICFEDPWYVFEYLPTSMVCL